LPASSSSWLRFEDHDILKLLIFFEASVIVMGVRMYDSGMIDAICLSSTSPKSLRQISSETAKSDYGSIGYIQATDVRYCFTNAMKN
jgi:hypothetical protein